VALSFGCIVLLSGGPLTLASCSNFSVCIRKAEEDNGYLGISYQIFLISGRSSSDNVILKRKQNRHSSLGMVVTRPSVKDFVST
jgi:hypothetical protein